MSVRTVEDHIYKAMAKTGTTRRDELAALLFRHQKRQDENHHNIRNLSPTHHPQVEALRIPPSPVGLPRGLSRNRSGPMPPIINECKHFHLMQLGTFSW